MTEEDPTAVDPDEPDESTLPPKPPVDVDEVTDEEIEGDALEREGEADVDFLDEEEADEDDTIDNAEQEEEPHDPSTLDPPEED